MINIDKYCLQILKMTNFCRFWRIHLYLYWWNSVTGWLTNCRLTMGRTWEGTEARDVDRMVFYAHPAHSAQCTLSPFGLPHTRPVWPHRAAGPFSPPCVQPIRPCTCPAYLARQTPAQSALRATGPFCPPPIWHIQTTVHPDGWGQWAQPSLRNWPAPSKWNWKCG